MFSRIRPLLFACALVPALVLAATPVAPVKPVRQVAPPLPFIPLRIDGKTASSTPEARRRAIAALRAQDPHPTQLVVLIHGWDTPERQSNKDYAQIGGDLRLAFQRRGEQVSVVGVQWDSNAGALRDWLAKSVASRLLRGVGLKKAAKDPYSTRVPMARSVGRRGLRELLLDLQAQFPQARLHVLAHSLGCEAAVHALNPETSDPDKDVDKEEEELPAFMPDRRLHLDLMVLAGADLDPNFPLDTPELANARLPKLLWVTVSEFGVGKDRILALRRLARNRVAVGNAGLELTPEQTDAFFSQRRLVFDSREIPRQHDIKDYFNADRIGRIADAAVALHSPQKSPSALLNELDAVLAAPDDTEKLREYVNSPEMSTRLYAAWRLEQLLCDGKRHLENGYAARLAAIAIKHPKDLEKERAKSPCPVVRAGYWPPESLIH